MGLPRFSASLIARLGYRKTKPDVFDGGVRMSDLRFGFQHQGMGEFEMAEEDGNGEHIDL